MICGDGNQQDNEHAVFEFELHDLPSQMGRKLLLVRLPFPLPVGGGGGGGSGGRAAAQLVIGTAHLESLDAAGLRAAQLQTIWEALRGQQAEEEGAVILCGDMNFDDGAPAETAACAGATDCWLALHQPPSDAASAAASAVAIDGATMPIDDFLGKPTRIDRIFVRGGISPHVSAMRLLGTAGIVGLAVPADGEARHPDGLQRPSDHYGLACEFDWSARLDCSAQRHAAMVGF